MPPSHKLTHKRDAPVWLIYGQCWERDNTKTRIWDNIVSIPSSFSHSACVLLLLSELTQPPCGSFRKTIFKAETSFFFFFLLVLFFVFSFSEKSSSKLKYFTRFQSIFRLSCTYNLSWNGWITPSALADWNYGTLVLATDAYVWQLRRGGSGRGKALAV